MKTTLTAALVALFTVSPNVRALDAPEGTESSFEQSAAAVQSQLEASLAELNELREQIAAEKIPLSRRLADLEGELVQVRQEYQQTTRLLDTRTLDLSNLRGEIKARQEEATYLSNLLGEYIRNFESRLHIAEIQRYEDVLEAAKLAPDNSNLSEQEVYAAQLAVVDASLDRLNDALGGTRFEGSAVDSSGLVEAGTFVLVGPAALFQAADGGEIGTAEQRIGSLEPAEIDFGNPGDAVAAATLISSGEGFFPLDPTLGNAHKIEATRETLWEHIQKGGVVMIPIFALAAAALLVALYKWIALALVRRPSQKRIKALLHAVAGHDREAAAREARAVGGPTGRMLVVGVEHLDEPHELIEEIMYETVLTTRLKVQRFLPFIAVAAASAPLLGLLGTVTGIITTFKLITVFGSGDVKTLSGGISEALITTEYGLIVAIPSLLLHAFLSRKARGAIDQMEKAAVAFVNQVSKAENGRERGAAAAVEKPQVPAPVRDRSDELVPELDGGSRDAVPARLDGEAAVGEPVAAPVDGNHEDAATARMAHQVKEFVDLLVPLVREKFDGEMPRDSVSPVAADDEVPPAVPRKVGVRSAGGTG